MQAGVAVVDKAEGGQKAKWIRFAAWRGLTLMPGCRGHDFNHDCVLWHEEALRYLGETLAQTPPIWSGATERAAAFVP